MSLKQSNLQLYLNREVNMLLGHPQPRMSTRLIMMEQSFPTLTSQVLWWLFVMEMA